jgi:hypothetical protein
MAVPPTAQSLVSLTWQLLAGNYYIGNYLLGKLLKGNYYTGNYLLGKLEYENLWHIPIGI